MLGHGRPVGSVRAAGVGGRMARPGGPVRRALGSVRVPIPFVPPLEPAYGVVDQVSPLIRRVVAENPSKYTYSAPAPTSSGAAMSR